MPSTWWSMPNDAPCRTPWPSSRSCRAPPGAPRSASAHGCRIRRSGTGPQWNATSSTGAASPPCSSPCAATSGWSTPTATAMPCSSVETPQGAQPALRSSPPALGAQRRPAPLKPPHPCPGAAASGYRGEIDWPHSVLIGKERHRRPVRPLPQSRAGRAQGMCRGLNRRRHANPPRLDRGLEPPPASSVPTTLPPAAMTPPGGCSEGTAGSSACGPPSTVTTGTTCAGATSKAICSRSTTGSSVDKQQGPSAEPARPLSHHRDHDDPHHKPERAQHCRSAPRRSTIHHAKPSR